MCWISTKKPERIVAEKDIISYKVIGGNCNQYYKSPFMKTNIVFNEILFEPNFELELHPTVILKQEQDDNIFLITNGKSTFQYQKFKGFHSYSNGNSVMIVSSSFTNERYLIVLKKSYDEITFRSKVAFNSGMNKIQFYYKIVLDSWNHIAMGFKELYLVKCIIPKGGIYFENENGEIVSDKIIITKEILPFKQIEKNPKNLQTFLDKLKKPCTTE